MKKLYTMLLAVSGTLSFGQTPIITGIMDGDCSGGHPKALEIYASGTVDFADYALENQTNASTTWGNSLSLAPLGIKTDTFVYIIYGDPTAVGEVFAAEFAAIPSANVWVYGTSPTTMNINGDDRVRLVNSTTSAVVDQYGVESLDGSGTAWEYTDSWAKRNNGTGPDGAAFNTANWTFGGGDFSGTTPDGALNGLGICQGAAAFSTVVPFGEFTLGISQNDIAGLQVYPNPVSNGTLFITSDSAAPKAVVVYDVLGKVVAKATVDNMPMNVSNLNQGVYIVKITEEGKTATRKLVVK